MFRYKLARLVNGMILSANQCIFKPTKGVCLEYKVGEITDTGGIGIACYKSEKYALHPGHIAETRLSFNNGNPIALLKLKPTGKRISLDPREYGYNKGGIYEGGINYASVMVIQATKIDGRGK